MTLFVTDLFSLLKVKSIKYRWIFEVISPENNDKFGKGIGFNEYNICKSKMGRARYPEEYAFPISMPHPSQICSMETSKIGRRSINICKRGTSYWLIRSPC